jgi:outer membrane protein assembly factor BamB
MLRILIMSFSAILLAPSTTEEKITFTPIEEVFPTHWTTNIGNVNFRENFLMTPNEIIIGSNGERYMDYNFTDRKASVYKINRKTGKIIQHFGSEVMGDMDVNGLLSYNNKLYYSNDNEELICATMNGKLIWSKPTSGDIEHEPVLLQHNNRTMIVYATETGEVKAIEPEKGKTIWAYYTPDFSGWKPTDNRMIFKVKSYFSNTYAFYTKPIKKDINNDGTEDLIYHCRNGELYAINGSNGRLLWKNDKINVDHIQQIPEHKNSTSLLAVGRIKDMMNDNYYKSYIMEIKNNGQYNILQLLGDNSNTGLNFYINGKEILINTDKYVYTVTKNKISDSTDRKMVINKPYSWNENTYELNINHGDMLFSNQSFQYKQYGPCLINLVQRNLDNYEHGFIEIISLKTKKIVQRLKLPGSSEMQPRIEDFNQDGSLDLLINCSDNNLYCYNLGKTIH